MGEHGHKLIVDKYSVETIADSMFRLYHAILNENLESLDFCYLTK